MKVALKALICTMLVFCVIAEKEAILVDDAPIE